MVEEEKIKFLILLFLGSLLFVPFIVLSAMFYLFVYVFAFGFGFIVYCFLLYKHVYKGEKPKYPLVPPKGRTDVYFPRADIPRQIYEDVRRYPEFFKPKKRKRKEIKLILIENCF